jgi:hypothetical protein
MKLLRAVVDSKMCELTKALHLFTLNDLQVINKSIYQQKLVSSHTSENISNLVILIADY